ncbi:MAG: hypothetical protein AAGG75_10735 [Bacteroidota bacterium]
MTNATDFNKDRHELILSYLQGKLSGKEKQRFLRMVETDQELKEELTFMQMLRLGGQELGKKYIQEELESIDQIKPSPQKPLLRRIPLNRIAQVAVFIGFIIANFIIYNNLQQQRSIASYLVQSDEKKELLQAALKEVNSQKEILNIKLSFLNTYWPLTTGYPKNNLSNNHKKKQKVNPTIDNWEKKFHQFQNDYKHQKQLIELYQTELDTLRKSIQIKNSTIQSYRKDITEQEKEICKINILLKHFKDRESYYLSEIDNITIQNDN